MTLRIHESAGRATSLLTLFVLSLASLGATLFLAAAPIYLRSIGLSTSESAFLIASTALPNVFLGAPLGRVVDRAPRRSLFFGLSMALASMDVCFVFIVPAISPDMRFWVAIVTIQIAAVLFSLLSTLTYQYLIPSLDSDETKAFASWEVATALASVAAAAISWTVLPHQSVGILILADAAALLVSGVTVTAFWPRSARSQEMEVNAVQAERRSMKIVLSNPILLGAAVGMITIAFCVHSFEANIALISFDGLGFGESRAVTFAALLGAFSATSAMVLQRHHTWITEHLPTTQMWCVNCYLLITLLLSICLYKSLSLLAVAAVFAIAVVEPVWSVVNARLLRAHTPEGRYGEIHGLIRMPRALFTFAGATLVGVFQGMGALWGFALVATLALLLLRTFLRRIGKRSEP